MLLGLLLRATGDISGIYIRGVSNTGADMRRKEGEVRVEQGHRRGVVILTYCYRADIICLMEMLALPECIMQHTI